MILRTSYYKGADFERDILHYFKEMGYYVIRSAGSKRLCDLIAVPNRGKLISEPLCIQCKKTAKRYEKLPSISGEELMKLRMLEENYKLKVLLAFRFRRGNKWVTEIVTLDEYEEQRKSYKDSK